MLLTEIQALAQRMGIMCNNKGRAELIHFIQTKEGYSPCFGLANGMICSQTNCCWRIDCIGKIGIINAVHTFEVE